MQSSRAVAVVLICLVLAGCGSVPRPFSPGAKTGGLPPPGPSSALIVHEFAGTEGTPLQQLTSATIELLQTKEVAAIPYEVANRYRMATQVDAVTESGGRALLTISVRFAQPDGEAIEEVAWDRQVDWNAYLRADPTLVRSMAQEISGRMLVLIGADSDGAPGAASGGPDLVIAAIRRAPGDGATALVDAMTSELERLGLATAPDDGAAQAPVLEAVVTVGPLDASNDLVRIVWLLRDRTGRERGRLEQQNSVPTGRLNQRWGVVAQLAASAAAPGVLDLLQRLEAGG